MASNGSGVVCADVDGLFTFQILACQDLLALPRAGRGPVFPDHPMYIVRDHHFGPSRHLFAFIALYSYRLD